MCGWLGFVLRFKYGLYLLLLIACCEWLFIIHIKPGSYIALVIHMRKLSYREIRSNSFKVIKEHLRINIIIKKTSNLGQNTKISDCSPFLTKEHFIT